MKKCQPSGPQIGRRAVLAAAVGAAASTALAGRVVAAAPAASTPLKIWDAHTHLSGVTGTVEQRVDQLLLYADRMGIERITLFLGTAWTYDPAPEQFRKDNDEVLRAVAHAPNRVFGFVYLNPKYEQESLAELERCVANGPMLGVKLWVAMKLNRPEVDPIIRRAAELQAPILQHAYWRTLPTIPGESGPVEVAEAAAKHPQAKFICAHTGNDWERGIRAIRATKNVWAEVSGFDPTAGVVEMAVRELGAERVLFGSDAGGRSYASQLAKVLSANLSEADNRLVLAENLRRLLQPIAATKGMKI